MKFVACLKLRYIRAVGNVYTHTLLLPIILDVSQVILNNSVPKFPDQMRLWKMRSGEQYPYLLSVQKGKVGDVLP